MQRTNANAITAGENGNPALDSGCGSESPRQTESIGSFLGTVFIPYRREETAGEALALFNDLVARIGEDLPGSG